MGVPWGGRRNHGCSIWGLEKGGVYIGRSEVMNIDSRGGEKGAGGGS